MMRIDGNVFLQKYVMTIINYFLCIFIFMVVLFFYVHILFHYKVGNELEIYEISDVCKDKLEEICDIRQPVIFDITDSELNLCKTSTLEYVTKVYGAFDVKIKGTSNETDMVPLNMKKAEDLFLQDKEGKYISYNNQEFLSETGIHKNIEYYDELFRPVSINNSYYDILFGSENASTTLKYELCYRNFFIVTQGEVKVKLIPPKNFKYLQLYNNYETFEFSSPMNPWNIQDKYIPSFDKVKSLEVILKTNKCIYIPPYWCYSFQFSKQSNILSLKYTTYMNSLSMFPQLFMYYLQNQNIQIQYLSKKLEKESQVEL